MFKVILCDCPWRYSNSSNNGAAEKHYQTMSIADLKDLQVSQICAEHCVLLFWATMPLLPDAIAVMQAWGFEYKTALPWIKVHNLEKLNPTYGTGFWIRGNAELVLIGARPGTPAPRSSYLGLLSERFQHSRKPAHLYEYAESLPGPRLEIFARCWREGWISIGNDLRGEDIRQSLEKLRLRSAGEMPLFRTKTQYGKNMPIKPENRKRYPKNKKGNEDSY